MCDSWNRWDGDSSLQGPAENCKWNMWPANSTFASDVRQLTGIVHNAAECVRSQLSNGMSGQKFVESESAAVPPPWRTRKAPIASTPTIANLKPISMPTPIPFTLTDLNGNYINSAPSDHSAHVANKDKSDVQQLALSGLKPVGSESVLAAPSASADILPSLVDRPPISTNNSVRVDNEGGGKQVGSDSVLAGLSSRSCAPRTVMAETSPISPPTSQSDNAGTVNSDNKEKQKEKSDVGQLSVGGVKQVGSESVLVVPPWRVRASLTATADMTANGGKQKETEQRKGKGNGKGQRKKRKWET